MAFVLSSKSLKHNTNKKKKNVPLNVTLCDETICLLMDKLVKVQKRKEKDWITQTFNTKKLLFQTHLF